MRVPLAHLATGGLEGAVLVGERLFALLRRTRCLY